MPRPAIGQFGPIVQQAVAVNQNANQRHDLKIPHFQGDWKMKGLATPVAITAPAKVPAAR
jgi:hypothetical protein